MYHGGPRVNELCGKVDTELVRDVLTPASFPS